MGRNKKKKIWHTDHTGIFWEENWGVGREMPSTFFCNSGQRVAITVGRKEEGQRDLRNGWNGGKKQWEFSTEEKETKTSLKRRDQAEKSPIKKKTNIKRIVGASWTPSMI